MDRSRLRLSSICIRSDLKKSLTDLEILCRILSRQPTLNCIPEKDTEEMTAAAIKIPMTSEDVTKNWLKTVLLSTSGINEVIVDDLDVCTNDGGVLSSILKANVKIDGEKHKLFIKIMPPPHLPQKVFIENFALDAIEVATYSSVFKQLEDFEREQLGSSSEIRSISCKFYAGDCCQDKNNRGFYIILEDISETFKMPDFSNGLNDDQIKNSLRHLAYFHSLSYCYGQIRKVDFLKDFPMPYHRFLENSDAQAFIDNLFQRAIKAEWIILLNSCAFQAEIVNFQACIAKFQA